MASEDAVLCLPIPSLVMLLPRTSGLPLLAVLLPCLLLSGRPTLSEELRVAPDTTGAPKGTLIVHVVGLDSEAGTVRIALDDEQTYDDEETLRAAALPIQDEAAHWRVTDVPPGTYAMRVYHDANGNGELDTNLFGAPQEAYGFSNDARGRFGPPEFEEAAVTLASDSLSISITVN